MAQADMFLKLTNIKGEALDSKHKDEIEVLSWSFGASQDGSAHGGTGSGTGKVSIQDLTITHYVDQSSTDLLKHLTNGKHIDEGMLTVRKAGGTAVEYMKLKMTQVMVTHISNGGGAGQDRITENVTLNFRKFTQTYTAQDDKGSPQAFLRVHVGYRRGRPSDGCKFGECDGTRIRFSRRSVHRHVDALVGCPIGPSYTAQVRIY